MLSCVIVDDEIGAIDILRNYVSRMPELKLLKTFQDSLEALDYLNHHPVDLVFLDIDMPNLSGMQLSDLMRARPVSVIFCTAYSEYAAESYERDAIDYLLKPIPFERFVKAVAKASERLSTAGGATAVNRETAARIFVKDGTRIHQVALRDVLFMKKDGHYIEFYLVTGKLLSRMNMAELLSALPGGDFIRIHRSYVIALDKIETINRDFVTIGKATIPIGDSYREELFRRIDFRGR